MGDEPELGPLLPALRDDHGPLRARRVWPDGNSRDRNSSDRDDGLGRLVVEATGADGRVVAATVEDGRVELIRYDPSLPALDAWRARPGTRLLAHRAGKRAVLSVSGTGRGATTVGAPTRFVKIARRSATDRAAQRLEAVRLQLAGVPGAPDVARVLERRSEGALMFSALPGHPVRDVIVASAAGDGLAAECAGLAVGRAMTAFAVAGNAPTLPHHHLPDELDVLGRWVTQALDHQVVRGRWRQGLIDAHRQASDRLGALIATSLVMTHRDLHDGQVLVDASDVTGPRRTPAVGFLDLDTAATADAGLDLANLLAHLDLLAGAGAGQSGTDDAGTRRVAIHTALGRFLQGLTNALHQHDHPVLAEDPARVEVLRAATRVRLAAVHAFRPEAPAVVPGLLAPSVLPPWTTHRSTQ